MHKYIKASLMICTALVTSAPEMADAKTAKKRTAASSAAALEARVATLEAELRAMREELQASRTQTGQMASSVTATQTAVAAMETQIGTLVTADVAQASKVEAVEKKVASATADGFRVGAATIKLGGFIKAETILTKFNDGDATGLARDFFVPGATPVGAAASREGAKFDGHVKQSRLTLSISAPVGDHKLGAYVETDFQSSPGTGDERVTNAYNLALRRGYLTYDNWLFGQDWSTFMNVGALPETTDFIGPSDGTVFARQAVIRYTHKVSDTLSLVVAAENPETTALSAGVLTAFDDDRLPDIVARANFKHGKSDFVLSAIARQLRVRTGTAFDESSFGWGLSASGKIAFGPSGRNDLRFSLNGGRGIGRYLGINFAPDVLIVNTAGTQSLEQIGTLSGFAALRYFWTDKARSTVSFSMIDVDHPSGISLLSQSQQSWSAAVNLFYTPAKGLDVGVEYRHANRKLLNGLDGDMDRLHFVAKQSF